MIFTLCHLKHLSSTDFEVLKPCQNVTVQTVLSNKIICMMGNKVYLSGIAKCVWLQLWRERERKRERES